MTDWTVDITIEEAGRTLLSERALPVPVRMIRDDDRADTVLVDGAGVAHVVARQRTDVSRHHMTLLTEPNGTLVIEDHSRNGVAIMSEDNRLRLIGKGNSMVVPANLSVLLDTVGFDVRVQSKPPRRVLRPQTNLHAELRLGGRLQRVALDRSPLVVMDGALLPGYSYDRHGDLIGISTATNPHRAMMVLAADSNGRMGALSTKDGISWINRRAMNKDQSVPVEHGTLLTFAGGHLHVIKAGAPRQLACVNDACLMLNDYKPNQNCLYCGTRLGDAHTRHIGSESRRR